MTRERCPYPDRFDLLYKATSFVRGRGYVDQWIECVARKDNGWYRFYKKIWNDAHTGFTIGAMVGTPLRWRELQRSLQSGDRLALIEVAAEADDVPDFADIL